MVLFFFINPEVFIEFGTKSGSLGKVTIELYEDKVPKTVKNFIELIKHKYKNSKIHRIVPGFVIQGGDYTRGDGTGGQSIYGKHFGDENFDLKHDDIGILSMANSGPDTNGSQFFITLDYTPHLDGKHVVFGKVKNNLEVLKRLEELGTYEGKPKETIKIINCGIKN
jgi:cyclophilin family peptidyl-prolyl cis-trans isomerase